MSTTYRLYFDALTDLIYIFDMMQIFLTEQPIRNDNNLSLTYLSKEDFDAAKLTAEFYGMAVDFAICVNVG